MKRSPMNRATPGALAWRRKKRKPIGESAKGHQERLRWQQERDEHLAVEPTCQHKKYGVPVGECWGPLDVQHVAGRGMGGRRGPAGKKVTLCRRAHDWVTVHPAEGRALGLVESMKGKR